MANSTKASSIGWMFVPQYYTFVNKDPAKLHCFYTKRSTLIHGTEGEDIQPCYGQQEIHEKIMSLGFEDCKVFVSTVDSQSSAENGIVVQVVGELSNKGGPWRKFAQTFFLAEQPNGYFVLNDIFRYIKEESDNEDDAEATEQETSTQAPTQDTPAAAQTAASNAQSSFQQPPSVNHDLELREAHGPSSSAAAVTLAPPHQAEQNDTRQSLENLANGSQEQQQVVDLHDELSSEQNQEVPQVNGSHDTQEQETEPQHAVPAPTSLSAQPTQTPAAAKPSTPEPIARPPQKDTSSSRPAQNSETTQAPTTKSEAEPAAAPAPSAPKTWANLAATGSGKWKAQVMSTTQGVSSAGPSSGTSTPAQTAAQTNTERAEGGSSIASGPRDAPRGQNQTRDFKQNVETPFSVVVKGVGENISHGSLRRRVPERLARGSGETRQVPEISYLHVDRKQNEAYIDFVEEWALARADGLKFDIDGSQVTLEKGKGNRRSGFQRRDGEQGGKGRGGSSAGGAPRGGAPRKPAGGRGGASPATRS